MEAGVRRRDGFVTGHRFILVPSVRAAIESVSTATVISSAADQASCCQSG